MAKLWILRGPHEAPGWNQLRKAYEDEKVDIIHLDAKVWAIINADEEPSGYEGLNAQEPADGMYIDPNGSPLFLVGGEVLTSAERGDRGAGPGGPEDAGEDRRRRNRSRAAAKGLLRRHFASTHSVLNRFRSRGRRRHRIGPVAGVALRWSRFVGQRRHQQRRIGGHRQHPRSAVGTRCRIRRHPDVFGSVRRRVLYRNIGPSAGVQRRRPRHHRCRQVVAGTPDRYRPISSSDLWPVGSVCRSRDHLGRTLLTKMSGDANDCWNRGYGVRWRTGRSPPRSVSTTRWTTAGMPISIFDTSAHRSTRR